MRNEEEKEIVITKNKSEVVNKIDDLNVNSEVESKNVKIKKHTFVLKEVIFNR